MYEKKFAVMLTDTQEIKTLECDPQEELFEIARGTIGCEWIELVEAEPPAKKGYLMLIDEEGKLVGVISNSNLVEELSSLLDSLVRNIHSSKTREVALRSDE